MTKTKSQFLNLIFHLRPDQDQEFLMYGMGPHRVVETLAFDRVDAGKCLGVIRATIGRRRCVRLVQGWRWLVWWFRGK